MNKKITILTFTLLALAVVFAACVPKVQPKNNEQISQNETIDTSDWKTYRNEEYGFEFKYPEHWGEVEIKKIGPDEFIQGRKILFQFSNRLFGRSEGEITPTVEIKTSDYKFIGPRDGSEIDISKVDFNKSTVELSSILKRPSTVELVVESYKINELKGLYLQEYYKELLDGDEGVLEYYVFPEYDQENILIVYSDSQISNILKNFVSTFKVQPKNNEQISQNETVDNSDWKTYRNEEYGFEFKYPEEWVLEEDDMSLFFDRNIDQDEKVKKELGFPLIVNIVKTSFYDLNSIFLSKFGDRDSSLIPKYNILSLSGNEVLNYSDILGIGGCHENFILINAEYYVEFVRHGSTCDYPGEIFEQIVSNLKFN